MALAPDSTHEARHAALELRRFVGDAETAGSVATMLKALAHPHRLRIVDLLCTGEHHVSCMVEQLDLPQAIVSQQLRILRMQGLVKSRRQDGHSLYRLAESRLHDLLSCLSGCPRVDLDDLDGP